MKDGRFACSKYMMGYYLKMGLGLLVSFKIHLPSPAAVPLCNRVETASLNKGRNRRVIMRLQVPKIVT